MGQKRAYNELASRHQQLGSSAHTHNNFEQTRNQKTLFLDGHRPIQGRTRSAWPANGLLRRIFRMRLGVANLQTDHSRPDRRSHPHPSLHSLHGQEQPELGRQRRQQKILGAQHEQSGSQRWTRVFSIREDIRNSLWPSRSRHPTTALVPAHATRSTSSSSHRSTH